MTLGIGILKKHTKFIQKKSTTLEIEGAKSIPESDIIVLNAGWNMLAYLRDNPMNIETALASLTNNNILMIAKDNMGNVFYPASILI